MKIEVVEQTVTRRTQEVENIEEVVERYRQQGWTMGRRYGVWVCTHPQLTGTTHTFKVLDS